MGPPTPPQDEHGQLQQELNEVRAQVDEMQRVVEAAVTPEEVEPQMQLLENMHTREQQLEASLTALEKTTATGGLIASKTTSSATTRGLASGGLKVDVYLKLPHVPISICYLLDAQTWPLVSVRVTNRDQPRRLRVRSYVEGYTATAVTTLDLAAVGSKATGEAVLLPTFFPDKTAEVGELTRATLHVIVDDLLTDRTELHETHRIWLLARNSAPIKIKRPDTAEFEDMRQYLAAFITPHKREVLEYLPVVAGCHPEGRLDGYFANQRGGSVIAQVAAAYKALKETTGLRYVSSFIDFNPNNDSQSQRVRLPRESLKTQSANCLDGAVLFASLLEAISLKPAIVYVPNHAMVAWQDDGVSDVWTVLDTTKMDRSDFNGAMNWGRITNEQWKGNPQYRFLPLPELRKGLGVTPLE